jgi:hypothetical protein
MMYLKGQIDIFYLIAYGFCTSIAILVVLMCWNQLSTSQSYTHYIANQTTNPVGYQTTQKANTALLSIGNLFTIVWIMSCIASIIATFFIDSSPIFAIVGILLMPLEIFISMIFHDFFYIMGQNAFIAPIITSLPYMAYFYTYLPITALIIAVISLVLTFSKPT